MKMRPYVIINCAASVDGKIALEGNQPIRLSNEEDMARVHRLRHECDAVLVGIGTVLADDPKLTVKEKYVQNPKQPLRVVLDSSLKTPDDAEVMKPTAPTLIATASPVAAKKKGHADIICCGESSIDLRTLLSYLYDIGVRKLLVEGGSTVIASFLSERIVDEIFVFFAPVVIGGYAPSIVGLIDEQFQKHPIVFDVCSIQPLGEGFLVKMRPRYESY